MARLPAFAKARKVKIVMAYRHAYLRTVKLMFTVGGVLQSTKPASNEAGNRAMPQVASELSPEAKNLAATMLTCVGKVARYTAHRAVRAKTGSREGMHVPFESVVPQDGGQCRRREKHGSKSESVLRCKVRTKTCL